MSTERTLPKLTITERRRDGSIGMKYKPLELIGSGGSAIAFSAAVLDVNDNPTDQICLLKEFYPTGASRNENDAVNVPFSNTNRALKKQFLREVSAGKEASQYIYGATTATSSFESENGNTYIVMPYEKHGMSLKNFCEWLKENGKIVPVRAWARLFRKLSDRVRNLHENAGILHSDISIGNVMIMQSDDPNVLYEYVCSDNADYTVILLDFGCAYFQDDVYIYDGSDILTAEKRDVVFTTNEFASPELQNETCREITTFTDIYSIVACFKNCINAVESGNKYIFSADIPATAKAQVNKVLGILNAGESEYIYKASILIEMFDELIRRIDGRGVSKAAIWEAARKDFETKCKGRFANLDIVEAILPIGRKAQGTLPVVASDGEKQSGVLDLIEQHKGRNICIYGDGGVGKTTTLVKKMHDEYDALIYDESRVVPIYIELNRCPANIVEAEGAGASQSHFIVRHIRKLLDGSDYSFNSNSEDDDDVLTAVQKEFRGEEDQGDSYDYLLLLDGLNEASSVTINGTSARLALIDEIRKVADDYRNVRIILTSRSEHGELNRNGEYMFDNIELEGITEETVLQYLIDNATEEHVKAAKNSESLMEILKTPLFLTVFARVKPDGMYTRGGLLRAFWQEKAESYYTQSSIHERSSADHLRKALNPEAYSLMLDFILPALCYEMEKNEEFRLPMDKVRKVIKSILDDDGEYGIFGDYGMSAFKEYTKLVSGKPVDISTVVDDLKDTLGKNAWREIVGELAESIAVLYPEENCAGYGIRHHHMRDYFVAVYWVNRFKLAWQVYADGESDKAYELLMPLAEAPLRVQALTFIGEYLDEDKNKPTLDESTGEWRYTVPDISKPCDRNLIKRVLDIFRGRFDESVGYGVYNLVEILIRERRELCGEDLSRLDLRHCTFDGIKLGKKGCGASLKSSLLGEINILPVAHSDGVNGASYSPDGRFIVSASSDNTVKVWDALTLALVKTLEGHSNWVTNASFSPKCTGCKYIVSASYDKTVKVWDTLTFALVRTLEGHSDTVTSVSYSPDGRFIVSTSWDHTVKVWDASTFALVKTLVGHSSSVNSASYSPDSRFIVSASYDGTVKVWESSTFTLVRTLEGHMGIVTSASYSPDGRFIVSASYDKTVKVWDALTFILLRTLEGHLWHVNSALYSPDGKLIVSASGGFPGYDSTIKVWDASNFTLLKTLEGHSYVVNSASYSPDGRFIVSASSDYTVKVWDTSTFALVRTLEGHSQVVSSASYSPDGKWIVSASGDLLGNENIIKLWNASTFALVRTLEGHSGYIFSVSYSPDGRFIVSASKDKTIKVWDASTFVLIKTLEGHSSDVTSASYSPDGRFIVSASCDKTVKVWDALTFILLRTLEGHGDLVSSASFSPDGKWIVSSSESGNVKVWDASTFALVNTLGGNSCYVTSESYSPDGKLIVSVSWDHTFMVWDALNFTLLKTLEGHSYDFNSALYSLNGRFIVGASYSPDGKCIVIPSEDGTVKVWDASTFSLVKTLRKHSKWVTSASYCPDGKWIVSASEDGTVKVWNASTFKCVGTIPNIPGLFVIDCDMRFLHPNSNLSDKYRTILRRYGAIVD